MPDQSDHSAAYPPRPDLRQEDYDAAARALYGEKSATRQESPELRRARKFFPIEFFDGQARIVLEVEEDEAKWFADLLADRAPKDETTLMFRAVAAELDARNEARYA